MKDGANKRRQRKKNSADTNHEKSEPNPIQWHFKCDKVMRLDVGKKTTQQIEIP